eukprot:3569708-Heterocapsa_arctica.AAC.1
MVITICFCSRRPARSSRLRVSCGRGSRGLSHREPGGTLGLPLPTTPGGRPGPSKRGNLT